MSCVFKPAGGPTIYIGCPCALEQGWYRACASRRHWGKAYYTPPVGNPPIPADDPLFFNSWLKETITINACDGNTYVKVIEIDKLTGAETVTGDSPPASATATRPDIHSAYLISEYTHFKGEVSCDPFRGYPVGLLTTETQLENAFSVGELDGLVRGLMPPFTGTPGENTNYAWRFDNSGAVVYQDPVIVSTPGNPPGSWNWVAGYRAAKFGELHTVCKLMLVTNRLTNCKQMSEDGVLTYVMIRCSPFCVIPAPGFRYPPPYAIEHKIYNDRRGSPLDCPP